MSGAGATRQGGRSDYVNDTNKLAAQGFIRPPEYNTLNRRRYNEDALRGGYYGPSASHAYGWNQADPWSQAQISHEQTRGRAPGTFEQPIGQAPMATQTPVGEYRPDTAFDLQEDRLPDPSWMWLTPPPGGRR